MITRDFVLIYEGTASHITDPQDGVTNEPGWIQSQDWPPILRVPFHQGRTDFIDDVLIDESGWEQVQNPDPVRHIPFYLGASDLGGVEADVQDPGWIQSQDWPAVLRIPYYLSSSDLADQVEPIGTGWEQIRDPDPVLRIPFYLSASDLGGVEADIQDPGWEQSQEPPPVLRIPFFLSDTILGLAQDLETESIIHQDEFVILRKPFFLSTSDLGGVEAVVDGPGWIQSQDPPPVVRQVFVFTIQGTDGAVLTAVVVVAGAPAGSLLLLGVGI